MEKNWEAKHFESLFKWLNDLVTCLWRRANAWQEATPGTGLISAPRLRAMLAIMTVKAWPQTYEKAGHTVPEVRKQRAEETDLALKTCLQWPTSSDKLSLLKYPEPSKTLPPSIYIHEAMQDSSHLSHDTIIPFNSTNSTFLPFGLLTSASFYVCVCIRICVCMYVHMSTHVTARGPCRVSSLIGLPFNFWGRVSHWSWSSLVWLGWLAREL